MISAFAFLLLLLATRALSAQVYCVVGLCWLVSLGFVVGGRLLG